MKLYNNELPLLSIHIPKCGGTSFKHALRKWYGSNLFYHYYDDEKNLRPNKFKLKKWHQIHYKKDVCIHGHFNHQRGFGIQDYYPGIKQAITFIRDPLEVALSLYFFKRRRLKEGKIYHRGREFELTSNVDEFLESSSSYISHFFPKGISQINADKIIDDYFVHIGTVEHYQRSMDILAEKLDKPKFNIPHKNFSERTQSPSEKSMAIFKSKCKCEYWLYEKALKANYII